MGNTVTTSFEDASRQPRGEAGAIQPLAGSARPAARFVEGDVMGKEARVGLLLGAAACLLAVLVDWVVVELNTAEQQLHR